jgi:hypothetical protein
VSTIDSASSGGAQSRTQQWNAALQHLQRAIRILDQSEAPAHIGANIDLIICRLRDAIEQGPEG